MAPRDAVVPLRTATLAPGRQHDMPSPDDSDAAPNWDTWVPLASAAIPPPNETAVAGGRALVIGADDATSGGGMALARGTNTAANSSAIALAVPKAEALYTAATSGTLDGAGLKIGILSDSFNLDNGESADIAAGLLPPASQIDILKEGVSGNDEGRAMAQLIYQIAPDAQIDFYTATDGESDFATGIATLAATGCNVIVDDVTYTDEPFYQDTGAVTEAVESAVAGGVDYFTAANNSGGDFFEANFAPMTVTLPGLGTVVADNVAASVPGGTASPYEAVYLTGAGAMLDFTVEWNQPFGANTYDLAVGLFALNGGAASLVRSFTAADLGGDPVLSVQTQLGTSVAAGTYDLVFYENGAIGGATPGLFKIVFFGDSNTRLTGSGTGIGSGASIGHELVPDANTVAAVNVENTPSQGQATPLVEGFSADGPGETTINAAGQTLATPIDDAKPDFAATDGSQTSVFSPFYGTSAAAPNAAAVSLLLLQTDGRLTTAQITYLLARSAIATASTITGGAGLIQANTAEAAALAAAQQPLWTAQGGSTLWSVAANWSDDAMPGPSGIVSITDGDGLFTGAETVAFDAGTASVSSLRIDGGTITGAVPVLSIGAGDLLATGTLELGLGTIALAGTLTDSGALLGGSAIGTISVAAGGFVSIGGAVAGVDIMFAGTGGRVVLQGGTAMAGGLPGPSISGFAAGDVLDLTDIAPALVGGVEVRGTAVTVVNQSGVALADLQVSGSFSALRAIADGTDAIELVACYLVGTRIATPDGARAIETLRIGDRVLAASGAARAVRWIGRRRYPPGTARGDFERQPVRFPAGSLGGGKPERDLYVSSRHAMLVGGLLVPAHRLIGWQGIALARLTGEIDYRHIELDTHDVILAEGAASETFADTGNRHMFDNAAEYAALYPQDARRPCLFCAPRLDDLAA